MGRRETRVYPRFITEPREGMKRAKLLAYLARHGCHMVREGGRHSIYANPVIGKTTSIPRHSEIPDDLAGKICKDLRLRKIRKGK